MGFIKDPQAKLDYQVDWSAWLTTDTIKTSTWLVPAGITKAADSHTTTTATIWLSGGSVGTTYSIANHIVTDAGREDERSLLIVIEDL